MNIANLLRNSAQLFPDKPVLEFDGRSLTYGELERQVSYAAQVLAEGGIQRGDRVCLVIANVPAFAIWYYAILKLGAIAVSVSTRLAAEEVAFIADDCRAAAVIASADLSDALRDHESHANRRWYAVHDTGQLAGDDRHQADGGQHEEQVPNDRAPSDRVSSTQVSVAAVDVDPHDPAIILYTSGTTGFPKGATLSHQNVRATVHAFNHLCRMRPTDRLLLAVPLFHCYGQNALLNSGVAVGASLVLQRRFDLNESRRLIHNYQVTKLFGVPTTFQLMLTCEPSELASVDYCFSAAATLPTQVAEAWQEKFGMPIYEGYGLTETAPFASYNHQLVHQPGSIGVPVDLVDMKVVDPSTGNECAPGHPGEIAIRGPNVMLGYWNRPTETEQVLRDGWFHSGDIGTMDERGYFYIVDRLKDMISIGGMKVFPAEVERVLLDHQAIAEAAVIGVVDEVMGEKVCALLVLHEQVTATTELRDEIASHCRRYLGTFKLPKRIHFVDSLPRNPAGKVLKTVLREQYQSGTQASLVGADGEVNESITQEIPVVGPLAEQLSNIHPATRQRHVMAIIQEQVQLLAELETAPEPDELLVEIGLDSLLIVALRDRLQEQVGTQIELPATLVFDQPRIVDLAGYLVDALEAKQPSPAAIPTASGVTSGSSTPDDPSAVTGASELAADVGQMSEEEALQELMREMDN